jgi:aspartate/methionine/tyrosine aminotransferase
VDGLSRRGSAAAAEGPSEYYAEHTRREGRPGYVGLCVAEDHQVAGVVGDRLRRAPPPPDEVLRYDDFGGRAAVRGALAAFLGRHLVGRPVDPAHVKVLSGAGAVLEALAFALGDPGDVVLVPTPSYAGFWPDLEGRAGLRIHAVPTAAADGFRLTPDLLDAALATAPGTVRALVLTNPDNPRGEVAPAEDVREVLRWAADRDLHVIADELYALSVHAGGPAPSAGRLAPSLDERLHLVWALSKDLGASGLRVGVLVSEHPGVLDAVEVQAAWCGVSSLAQHAVADVLADDAWVAAYLPGMRTGLARSAAVVRAALDEAGIPRTRGDAGLFLLADLRRGLDAPTWEAEHRLWRRLLDDAEVNLTPGAALRAPEPGWFRICHAGTPLDVLDGAVRRVAAAVTGC